MFQQTRGRQQNWGAHLFQKKGITADDEAFLSEVYHYNRDQMEIFKEDVRKAKAKLRKQEKKPRAVPMNNLPTVKGKVLENVQKENERLIQKDKLKQVNLKIIVYKVWSTLGIFRLNNDK